MATITAVILGDSEHEDHELTVVGTVHAICDVEIESIRDEHGVEIDATKGEIERAEQALIDAHVAMHEDDDSPRDRAIDRAMYFRKARLEERE